jgi:hypothetical protein
MHSLCKTKQQNMWGHVYLQTRRCFWNWITSKFYTLNASRTHKAYSSDAQIFSQTYCCFCCFYFISFYLILEKNLSLVDSAVGIGSDYGQKSRGVGVRVQVGAYRFWGLSSLLSNGYWVLFPRWYSGQGMKLTTHLQLLPKSRIHEFIIHSPIHLHGVVLNYSSRGKILLPIC